MAGPLTIQRFPRGLLDALGMKGTGDAPQTLSATLAACFDATDLYLYDKLTVYAPAGSKNFAAGAWFSISNDVPTGELWLVIDAGIHASTGVGVTVTGAQFGYLRKGASTANSPLPFHNAPGLSLAASQNGSWGGPLARPLILGPGDVLAIGNTAMTGAPVAWPNMSYYRLTF